MSNKNQDKMDGIFEDSQAENAATGTDKPARPPKPKMSIGRETKVGLAVIAALLVIFVIVLVVRLRGDGEGDGDLAQNGTSKSEVSTRDRSDEDKPKASSSRKATVITPQTDQGGLQPYRPNPWEATSDTANSGNGPPYSDKNRAPAQNGSQIVDPRMGIESQAIGAPADRFSTQTDVVGSTKNPFDARSTTPPAVSATDRNTGSFLPPGNNPSLGSHNELNIGRTSSGSAVEQTDAENASRQKLEASLPAHGIGGTVTQQANVAPAGVTENSGELAPPFENNGMKGGTTALKNRRLDGFENPQQVDATSSGVRIVGDRAIDQYEGSKSIASSTELEKVQGIEPDAEATQPAATRVADAHDIDSFNDPRFGKKQPKQFEPAPVDDALSADDEAPARLSASGVSPADELYTVERNDNYWSIAQKRYGSGAYFKALYEYNRRQADHASVISPGAQLRLPDEATLQRLFPTLCPPPQRLADRGQARIASANVEVGQGAYNVQDGDTLFKIARRELGNGSRFAEVYELNRDQIGEPTERLQPGTRLRLPDER
jgi:nucleoid-associated protein YgaU